MTALTFDNVARGYNGKLYLKVFPMSFDLKVKARFIFKSNKILSGKELQIKHRRTNRSL